MYISDGERFPNARVVKIDAKSYKVDTIHPALLLLPMTNEV
jgi:hypothetical protein